MTTETVLQFGSGRFLRGFADYFLHEAHLAGRGVGRAVVVQSTGRERVAGFNAGGGRYPVAVRGYQNGRTIDRTEVCEGVSRAVSAADDWPMVLAVATSPDLTTILSNTTEAGYRLDPADSPSDAVPRSFPAKLVAVLLARFHAGLPGPTVIPCELLEGNAGLLRGICADLATRFGHPPDFIEYLAGQCVWLEALVDRIVTGPPAGHPLAADPLACVAEPFAFWALQDDPRSRFMLQHPAITRTANVRPYFLRKVRILNAAHTALVAHATPLGFTLVREALADPDVMRWLRRLLFEEIVPTVADRVEGATRFAEETLERFQNPFLDHKLSDIALEHAAKVAVRLRPTGTEYLARHGRAAPLLATVID